MLRHELHILLNTYHCLLRVEEVKEKQKLSYEELVSRWKPEIEDKN